MFIFPLSRMCYMHGNHCIACVIFILTVIYCFYLHRWPINVCLAAHIPLSLAMNLMILSRNYDQVTPDAIKRVLLGVPFGSFLGTDLHSWAPECLMRALMGFAIVLYVGAKRIHDMKQMPAVATVVTSRGDVIVDSDGKGLCSPRAAVCHIWVMDYAKSELSTMTMN